jgi:hypothetical protein
MYALPAYNMYSYDWLIDWGDGTTQRATGTGASGRVINHTYSARDTYTITITPAGSKDAWLKAFGSGSYTAIANALKITSCTAVLTPLMVASAAEIAAGTVGAYSFNGWFRDCAYLTSLSCSFSKEWEQITTVGAYFCMNLCYGCTRLTELSTGFTMPQKITVAGDRFLSSAFHGCTLLSSMSDGFNLPQGITSAGEYFCANLFYLCPNLIVNSEFRFPVLSIADLAKNGVFSGVLYMSIVYGTVLAQNRTAASFINGNGTPPTDRNTFACYNDVQGAARWSDYVSLDVNWR